MTWSWLWIDGVELSSRNTTLDSSHRTTAQCRRRISDCEIVFDWSYFLEPNRSMTLARSVVRIGKVSVSSRRFKRVFFIFIGSLFLSFVSFVVQHALRDMNQNVKRQRD